MRRDLFQLAKDEFDLLVIGGGISGATVAWDAALRGLRVAVIDKGDFGGETSANSLKTIHGGLRYLQDGNLRRMRMMSRERSVWLRIAPHLVHPLPCVLPTGEKISRGRLALGTALRINDWIGYDRNQNLAEDRQLPSGRLLSRSECLEALPGVSKTSINGGALWYDAQMRNSERLLLSFLLGASRQGAIAANYVAARGLIAKGDTISGVRAKDVISGDVFDIRARIVVNCAGPWVDDVLSAMDMATRSPRFFPSAAMNLVTRKIWNSHAGGVPSKYRTRGGSNGGKEQSRILFVAPWREYSLIGTVHSPWIGRQNKGQPTEEDILDFVNEFNRACPGVELTREDVYHVHFGLLPAHPQHTQDGTVKLVRESQIIDHLFEDGVDNLITVMGVKYTTARVSAARAVDLAFRKLGKTPPPSRTHDTPVFGGDMGSFNKSLQEAVAKRPVEVDAETIEHLVSNYGSEYQRVLEYVQRDPASRWRVSNGSAVIKAEVRHAVCEEMAQKLTDVVLRRTELGSAGAPDEHALATCAEMMSPLLGWSKERRNREIAEVRAMYATGG